MTVYSTYSPTALFAGSGPYRHRSVTLAAGPTGVTTVYKRGTLLGRVTGTDKYIPSVATATDGSQLAVNLAILSAETDVSLGDVVTPVYESGPYAFEVMIVDPSWTYATLDNALRIAGSEIYVKTLGSIG